MFSPNWDPWVKVDLSKGYWNPQVKHFSEIMSLGILNKNVDVSMFLTKKENIFLHRLPENLPLHIWKNKHIYNDL